MDPAGIGAAIAGGATLAGAVVRDGKAMALQGIVRSIVRGLLPGLALVGLIPGPALVGLIPGLVLVGLIPGLALVGLHKPND